MGQDRKNQGIIRCELEKYIENPLTFMKLCIKPIESYGKTY